MSTIAAMTVSISRPATCSWSASSVSRPGAGSAMPAPPFVRRTHADGVSVWLPARGRPLQGAGVDPANGYDRGDQQRAPLERVDGDGGDRPHAHGRGAAARAER